MPSVGVVAGRVGGEAGEGRAVVPGRRGVGIEDLGEAVRAADSAMLATAARHTAATAVKPRIAERQDQHREHRRASPRCASIFLPRYSGVRPTISPATKTAISDEDQHAVEAGADAAEETSPSWIRNIGTRPPSGVKLSCMALTAAVGAAGGRGRPERRTGDAEADFLAFHIAGELIDARAVHGSGLPWVSAQ